MFKLYEKNYENTIVFLNNYSYFVVNSLTVKVYMRIIIHNI